jgi:hypothetical protein
MNADKHLAAAAPPTPNVQRHRGSQKFGRPLFASMGGSVRSRDLRQQPCSAVIFRGRLSFVPGVFAFVPAWHHLSLFMSRVAGVADPGPCHQFN